MGDDDFLVGRLSKYADYWSYAKDMSSHYDLYDTFTKLGISASSAKIGVIVVDSSNIRSSLILKEILRKSTKEEVLYTDKGISVSVDESDELFRAYKGVTILVLRNEIKLIFGEHCITINCCDVLNRIIYHNKFQNSKNLIKIIEI